MNTKSDANIKHENPTAIQESYRAFENRTLLDQIMEKSDRSKSASKKLLSSGRVSVNGKITTSATVIPELHALITVHRGTPPRPFAHRLLEIVWENNNLLIVYKKRGIPTVNTAHRDRQETALWVLSKHYKETNPDAKLFMINRLDRSTAGFIIFAKNIESKERMISQWSRIVQKQLFIACIEGEITEKEFLLTAYSDSDQKQGGKLITAKIQVDKSSNKGLMHIVQADTGARIFSLRKLFGDNNFGIFGDVRSKSSFRTEKDIALEQIALELVLPDNEGRRLSFQRPYPTHYFQLLRQDK